MHVQLFVLTYGVNAVCMHRLILYSCLIVRQVPYNVPRVLDSREL